MRPHEDEGLTLTALLDLLEEQPPGARPSMSRRPSVADAAAAAAPRVGTAAREAATAAGAIVLLVLVPLAAVLVLTAERTAKAVTAADLPARGRSLANRIPGLVEDVEARSQRAAQWVLGPQGIWTGHGPRSHRIGGLSL